MMVICCTGILLGYTAGAYVSYQNIPYVFIILPVIFLATFIFFPETPQFLLIKNDNTVSIFLIAFISYESVWFFSLQKNHFDFMPIIKVLPKTIWY